MARPQTDYGILSDAIKKAVETLQSALVDDTAEFPKMMYHPNLEPKTVANEMEQKVAEAQGWSVNHDPTTVTATTGPKAMDAAFPKTMDKHGSPSAVAVNTAEEKRLEDMGYVSREVTPPV